jgi:ABC-2 type transport system ATP-binding protein
VAILDHGTVLAMGSPSELVARYCPGHVVRFSTGRGADLGSLRASVENDPASHSHSRVSVHTDMLEPVMEELMEARRDGRFAVEDLRVDRMSLEDVFLHLTGRRIRD